LLPKVPIIYLLEGKLEEVFSFLVFCGVEKFRKQKAVKVEVINSFRSLALNFVKESLYALVVHLLAGLFRVSRLLVSQIFWDRDK
jgi:hypothetical protein